MKEAQEKAATGARLLLEDRSPALTRLEVDSGYRNHFPFYMLNGFDLLVKDF